MRAIDLDLTANGNEYRYKFVRDQGMDNENATYNLVLDDFNQRFPLITQFIGTLDDNIQSLANYLQEHNFEIVDIRGDDYIDFNLRNILRR